MAAAFIASAGGVSDEHPLGSELVTVGAALGWECHPPVVGGVDEITDVGHGVIVCPPLAVTGIHWHYLSSPHLTCLSRVG